MTARPKLAALGARVGRGEGRALRVAARLVARRLARWPAVSAVALSGSLVREPAADVHGDADFFVLAAEGRAWAAFLACLWEGWRLARSLRVSRLRFCFNYVLDESRPDRLDLAHPDQARELLGLRILFGRGSYARLLAARAKDLAFLAPGAFEARLRRCPPEAGRGGGPGGEASRRGGRPGAELALALVLPLFVLAVKLRERARRRAHPEAVVHSGGGVVRSHLRTLAPYAGDGRARAAFDALAPHYPAIAARPANRHMRARLREALSPLAAPGSAVLDLGAGLGYEALWLAERGAAVVALDPSPEMVRRARERARARGLEARITVCEGDLADAERLAPAGGFDLVVSAFGPLNLMGAPAAWRGRLARLLRPGGRLVALVMNAKSLWRPFWSGAPAALEDGPWWSAPAAGWLVPVRLFDAAELRASLPPLFRVLSLAGLCVAFPPPGPDRRLEGAERSWLGALDGALGRVPVVGAWGDHLLLVAERTRARP